MTALAGLLVVDVSGSVATSYCAKIFADYGAEVVNVEPPEGFPTRALPPFVPTLDAPENSAIHAYLHAKKRSVCVQDVATVQRLVEHADLLLDDAVQDPDFRFGGVRCHVTWFGRSGSWRDHAGSDGVAFALNGMVRMLGRVEGPPLIPTGYQAQMVGGKTAFIASLGHLFGRETDAGGSVDLDVSIAEAMMCFTEVGVVSAYNTGLSASRMGVNRFPPTYPLGVFPCRDGWIGLTVLTPSQWHTFCRLLGLEEFVDVPLFQTSVGRLEAVEVLEPMIAERLLEHSAETLFYRAQEARVPLARVPTMDELLAVDQFAQRGAFMEVGLPNQDTLTVPSVPFRLFATPPTMGGEVATLGQHNGSYL